MGTEFLLKIEQRLKWMWLYKKLAVYKSKQISIVRLCVNGQQANAKLEYLTNDYCDPKENFLSKES